MVYESALARIGASRITGLQQRHTLRQSGVGWQAQQQAGHQNA